MAGTFLLLVGVIVCLSVREWILLLARRKPAVLRETEPVWLPDYAVTEGGPKIRRCAGAAALALALAKELSGEAQLERAQQQACVCETSGGRPEDLCRQPTEARFNGVRRCC